MHHDLAMSDKRDELLLAFSLDPNPYIIPRKAPNWFNALGYVCRDKWTGQFVSSLCEKCEKSKMISQNSQFQSENELYYIRFKMETETEKKTPSSVDNHQVCRRIF